MIERGNTVAGVDAAVAAWSAVRPGGAGARLSRTASMTLKRAPGSVVHRLAAMGPGGSDVIAKWTHRATAELEHSLYRNLLPDLGVATVRSYGVALDDDEATAWLFLEDAGGIPFSPQRREHRLLAARWLAAVHTAAAAYPAPTGLPARDAAYYRGLLERFCEAIVGGFAIPDLTLEHLRIRRALLNRCQALLDRWPDLENLCAAMPETLVHSDFAAKNVRVRDESNGRTLVAFDWENAGWGLAGIDLRLIDLDEYARRVRGAWPAFGGSGMATAARLGRIFWFASCVGWEMWAFDTGCMWRLVNYMPAYERHLGLVMAELGWA
jgi:hypothetical protein